MKIALLGDNLNKDLVSELKRETIKDTYDNYPTVIITDIFSELNIGLNSFNVDNLLTELRSVLIITINKVILDNMMKYITTHNVYMFKSLVERSMLGQDIYVNAFYVTQITDIVNKYYRLDMSELNSITDIITNRLSWIINDIYVNNSVRYNEIFIQLLNDIYLVVSNMQFNYYKFELDRYYRPLLIYSKKDDNELTYS